MMEASQTFFEITAANVVVYDNQSEGFEGFLHHGSCWCALTPENRTLCSIFEMRMKEDFDRVASVAMGDLRGSDFLLQIYGTARRECPDRYYIITQRIDSTFSGYFWEQHHVSHDHEGFLLKEVSDMIRDIISYFGEIWKMKIGHGDITGNKIFLAGGKVKLFLIKFDCRNKGKKEWESCNLLDMNSLHQMFNDNLPQPHPNLLREEYVSFCSERDFLEPKLKYHPFLWTHVEREEIVIRAHRRMKKRIGGLRVNISRSWTSRIRQANRPSICTAVFNYPSIQRQKRAAEQGLPIERVTTPKDYGDNLWSYVEYLRNFGAHIEDPDTLTNYKQIMQDSSADIPSLPERNLALARQFGGSYLLRLYNIAKFEELSP